MKMELTVNGTLHTVHVPPMRRLLDILREDLGLLGTKEGCGEGECGACAVLMNGELVDTCLIPAIQAAGSEILTIEGLGDSQNMDPLQRAFVEEGAVHCGFCTPGMVLAARALLEKNPSPTEMDVRVALSGNICRCTGYEKICKAVMRAVQEGYAAKLRPRVNHCTNRRGVFSEEEQGHFFSPQNLTEALKVLRDNPGITLLSGGTDIGPDMKSGKFAPAEVMDIFSLPELKGIHLQGETLCIGACTSNTDILMSPLTREHLPALITAAARSGAPAIQNRATIGGNIVTASGAGDLPVVLHALGASVIVASEQGERTLSLEEFMLGYRKTALRPGELLKSILIPMPAAGSKQAFYKRGSRKALTLSRVSVAFYVHSENGKITSFRAAAGSMSPIPIRLKHLEEGLIGQPLNGALAEKAARLAEAAVNPRKSPAYRRSMTANLTRRFFEEEVETI